MVLKLEKDLSCNNSKRRSNLKDIVNSCEIPSNDLSSINQEEKLFKVVMLGRQYAHVSCYDRWLKSAKSRSKVVNINPEYLTLSYNQASIMACGICKRSLSDKPEKVSENDSKTSFSGKAFDIIEIASQAKSALLEPPVFLNSSNNRCVKLYFKREDEYKILLLFKELGIDVGIRNYSG